MTLPAGSKDLIQILSQNQQGSSADYQCSSHLGTHSDSKTHALAGLQSRHTLNTESAPVKAEAQDTLTTCHFSNNDGVTLPIGSKILPKGGTTLPIGGVPCPSATISAPLTLKNSLQTEDTQHRTHSSSVILPHASSSLDICSIADQQQDSSSARDQKKTCKLPYVLFAIDGTWQEAKEIYKV